MEFTRSITHATVAILSILVGFIAVEGQQANPTKPQTASYYAFRDSVDKAPPGSFKLSHNYPLTVPSDCKKCKWLKLDVVFTAKFPESGGTYVSSPDWHADKWDEYVQLLLDYVREGQDPNLDDSAGFRTVINRRTKWYNVPWMAYDPTVGREFSHGTTNERTARVSELVPGSSREPNLVGLSPSMSNMRQQARSQLNGSGELALLVTANLADATKHSCDEKAAFGFETWSVGFYNEWGGYALGQAFPATGQPRLVDFLGSTMPAGLPFPEGTVVTKVLTTTATAECVDTLKGAPEWHVNRHKFDLHKGYRCERELQTTRILQIDIAVVDKRSPTRWVYGTFAYDGNKKGETFWDRLVPVGVQWGADPWSFPAVPPQSSLPLQQTVLNPESKPIMAHYGCPGRLESQSSHDLKDQRLAGPVDNQASSCISCHSSAYAAPHGAPSTMGSNVPPSFGFDGMCNQYSLDNAAYFQNQQPPQHFPGGRFPDAISLDTSLQMEVAFDQYGRFYTDHAPLQCSNETINQVKPHN